MEYPTIGITALSGPMPIYFKEGIPGAGDIRGEQ